MVSIKIRTLLAPVLTKLAILLVGGLMSFSSSILAAQPPNIVLMMADDLGWGDVGYNGNTEIKTPNLDLMSQQGLQFTRFYAQAPVCSPTRGSVLTGRHPFRYGIFEANVGKLRSEEITLPELLQQQGYATGHFGKWHLGTLSKTWKKQKGGGSKAYSPPQLHGYDEHFVVHHSVPTWDPMGPTGQEGLDANSGFHKKGYYNPFVHNGEVSTEALTGDSSRIYVDKALPFMRKAVSENKPFFVVLWFNTPHSPVVAGAEYRALYKDKKLSLQHYYGSITAMDEQVGRVRNALQDMGVSDNTMLWFTSDNGPTGAGSSGDLRAAKRHLFEGGIRVPTIMEWPAKVAQPRVASFVSSTSDYLPTIIDMLDINWPQQTPLDGLSLMPLIENKQSQREQPIYFQSHGSKVVMTQRYKFMQAGHSATIKQALGSQLIAHAQDWMIFDLEKDPSETDNIAAAHPELLSSMQKQLTAWMANTQQSFNGDDYNKPYITDQKFRLDAGKSSGAGKVKKNKMKNKNKTKNKAGTSKTSAS